MCHGSVCFLWLNLCCLAPPALCCRLPGHRTLLTRLLFAGLLTLFAALRLLERAALGRPRGLALCSGGTFRCAGLASGLRFDLPRRAVLALLLLRRPLA